MELEEVERWRCDQYKKHEATAVRKFGSDMSVQGRL